MCEGESDGGSMKNAQFRDLACRLLMMWVVGMAPAICAASTLQPSVCEKVILQGEVTAGQEWKAPIGEGWVFHVMPIDTGKPVSEKSSNSGWDLVVDREQAAGFPDALLLATPPYDSINEREVGTTFGMRAQDVIGWNPRSFRFLTQGADLHAAQQLFLAMRRDRSGGAAASDSKQQSSAGSGGSVEKLMEFARNSAAGQFQILEARLTPGIADAAPFAENWALGAVRTPHTFESAAGGQSTPLGRLGWMRFSITLWLPPTWKAPASLGATRSACSE